MKNLARKNILSIRPYEPGKPIEELERELGIRNIIKLASNENALGPSPKAVKAMRKVLFKLNRYPDGGCFYLKKALAAKLKVKEENIIFGNGSNEIIELLVRAFLKAKDEVLTGWPSFLIYPLAGKVSGAKVELVPLKNFRYDLRAIKRKISKRTKLIFISNPNNPTGTYLKAKEVDKFLKGIPREVIIVFDEAYIDFVREKDFPSLINSLEKGNIVILRTFSKAYGLSGLRIGYGLARGEIVQCMNKVRQPFNVNSLAQVGALAALDDEEYLKRSKNLVRQGKRYLYRQLDKLGFGYIKSSTNFILINVKEKGENLFKRLLKEGIIVRDMQAYGLDNYIRVTIGLMEENRRFIRLLKAISAFR